MATDPVTVIREARRAATELANHAHDCTSVRLTAKQATTFERSILDALDVLDRTPAGYIACTCSEGKWVY